MPADHRRFTTTKTPAHPRARIRLEARPKTRSSSPRTHIFRSEVDELASADGHNRRDFNKRGYSLVRAIITSGRFPGYLVYSYDNSPDRNGKSFVRFRHTGVPVRARSIIIEYNSYGIRQGPSFSIRFACVPRGRPRLPTVSSRTTGKRPVRQKGHAVAVRYVRQ